MKSKKLSLHWSVNAKDDLLNIYDFSDIPLSPKSKEINKILKNNTIVFKGDFYYPFL
jgi:hypothetical protein